MPSKGVNNLKNANMTDVSNANNEERAIMGKEDPEESDEDVSSYSPVGLVSRVF